MFWLFRPFFGYIPPSIAKKGGIFLKRRWYFAKVVYSLIGIYDKPEPGGLGRAGGQGPEAPSPPASLSLGLDWIGIIMMMMLRPQLARPGPRPGPWWTDREAAAPVRV